MFRKVIVALVMIVMINGCAQVRKDNFSVAWKHFHSAFYDNGRIVDTGNENVSHSEGQGYGMLFAVTAGDKAHFDEPINCLVGAMYLVPRQTALV